MRGSLRLSVIALLLAAFAACSTRTLGKPAACPGFVPARLDIPGIPQYPAPLRKARMSGESNHEIVVDGQGKVREARIVGTTFMLFSMAADTALRKSRYFPATLEGRPVATRFRVRMPFGVPKDVESSPARNRVTAFVPGEEPAAARWQLAGSVRRVTVLAHAASVAPSEVSVVAVAPDGRERVLVSASRSRRDREIRIVARTEDFFSKPGEYRLRLKQKDQLLTEGGFTVAEDEESAVINACGGE